MLFGFGGIFVRDGERRQGGYVISRVCVICKKMSAIKFGIYVMCVGGFIVIGMSSLEC